jgi:hypothetical protein
MKIMVCLVSDQHVPNFLTVRVEKPDLLILVVTPEMEKKNTASNFLKALACGKSGYTGGQEIVCLEDGNSVSATMKKLEDVFEDHLGDEWVVNLTGGTKPMSIGAFEFFKDKAAKLLYVSIGRQSHATNFADNSQIPLDYNVSIREFLAGYGFDFLKAEDIVKADEALAKKLFRLSAHLAANYDLAHQIMHDLDRWITQHYGNREKYGSKFKEKAREKARSKGIPLTNFEVQNRQISNLLEEYFQLDENESGLSGNLTKETVKFLTGGWLEVFFWGLLCKHSEKLNIWDVRFGLHPGKKDSKKDSKSEVRNDWDVSFMFNQSLRFVECKTGIQDHDPMGNDTLYKVEAIKKQLGALNVKSYLATTSQNIIEEGKIKCSIGTRAKLYGCIIIPGNTIKKLALSELDHDPNISQLILDAIFPKKEEDLNC